MPKKTALPSAAPPIKNKVMRFAFAEVPRSDIREAPYNPRVITQAALDKIHDTLTDPAQGLVEPLVWNKRTGNLVGGHQRIAAMDDIHGGDNYFVPVAVIDVDEPTEKILNVKLNNPAMQGDWDAMKLEQLLVHDGVDPFAAGFELLDLVDLYPEGVVTELIKKYIPEDEPLPTLTALPGTSDAASVQDTADAVAKMKAARKEHKQADGESLRSDHMLVVVFQGAEETSAFMRSLRLPLGSAFVMVDTFVGALRQFGGDLLASAPVEADAAPPT